MKLVDFLKKYAPSSENDTEIYILNVCQRTGYNREEIIDNVS
jgi:hypothetical protein